jgi:hypothetical protein
MVLSCSVGACISQNPKKITRRLRAESPQCDSPGGRPGKYIKSNFAALQGRNKTNETHFNSMCIVHGGIALSGLKKFVRKS